MNLRTLGSGKLAEIIPLVILAGALPFSGWPLTVIKERATACKSVAVAEISKSVALAHRA